MRFSLLASLAFLAVIIPSSLYATEGKIEPFCKNGENSTVNAILGTEEGFLTPIRPVSDHFTGKVLRRAEKGIEKAFSYTQTFNDDSFMSWAEISFEAVSKTIDTKTHLIQQERSLKQDTACLRIDLFLIETMMEKVRCKIQYAFEQKQSNTIRLLKDIILFLEKSHINLIEGARNNAYMVTDYSEGLSFDDQEYMNLCPFNSDYLPPSSFASGGLVLGYGCDIQTLGRYGGIYAGSSKIGDAVDAELEALQNLIYERDEFIKKSQYLKDNAINIETWMGRTPSPELEYFGQTINSEREHYAVSGCSESPDGWIEPVQGDEEENADRDPNSLWPPVWPSGAIRWRTRGAFSFDRNEMQMMQEYEKLRTEWGRRRPLAYELPDEFGFLYFFQLYFRTQLKKWDIYQEQQMSTMVARATDAPQRIANELAPLRRAIGEFSAYASVLPTSDGDTESKGGIRGFARGLAYYLRRSCLTRPCNERLERILKVVFTDTCFPYTAGSYGKKIWEDCKRDAKLDEFAD